MTSVQTRGKYITEFKLEALRQVKIGQAIAVVSKVLNVPKASLGNWDRLDRRGDFGCVSDQPGVTAVTPVPAAPGLGAAWPWRGSTGDHRQVSYCIATVAASIAAISFRTR